MDGVIIPTLVPPPLSPMSSVSSESQSVRKSLSKRSSLQKILSATNCSGLHVESVDASITDRSGAVEADASVVTSRSDQESSFGIDSLLPPFVRRSSTEGSMDIDDYCAKPKAGPSENKQTTLEDNENEEAIAAEPTDNGLIGDIVNSGTPVSIEENAAMSDPENSICSEDLQGEAAELERDSTTNVEEVPEVTSAEITDNAEGNTMDEDHMDTEANGEATNSDSPAGISGNNDAEVSTMPRSPSATTSTTPDATSVTATSLIGGPPPIEILISFDTTGSMSYYLDEVKNEINNIIHRLFMDVPNMKIGLIAHGDYCDASVYYLTQTMDFSFDVNGLCEMVKNVEGTGGGDFEECYELILRMARQVKWTPGSQRALVMIGDACPHTTDSLTEMGKEPIDWKVEAAALKYEMGVQIYGVQCQDHKEAGTFWQDLATLTRGEHLKLDKFATIIDIILAICYRESGPNHLQAYELEVRAREGRMLATELDQAFQVLRGTKPDNASTAAGPSVPKPTSNSQSAKVAPKSVKLIAPEKRKPKQNPVKKTPPAAPKNGTNGRKPTTKVAAQKKQTTRKSTPKKPPVHKLLREQVTEAHFLLNRLKWTPWIKMMSSHDHKTPKIWQKRHSGIGYKYTGNLDFLDNYKHKCAIYEIAVQLQPRGKQIIVYNHVTKGISHQNPHWLRQIFKSKVNKAIDCVLQQCPHASISLRRAILQRNRKLEGQRIGSASTCRAVINRRYDYAWKGPKASRTLIKKGVTIVMKGIDSVQVNV